MDCGYSRQKQIVYGMNCRSGLETANSTAYLALADWSVALRVLMTLFRSEGLLNISKNDGLPASWTARVWEAETGKPVGAPLQHGLFVVSAAFSPDGRRVVTASEDKTAQVWEADTGKPVGVPLQHQGPVKSAAFSPDSRRVVTASSDMTARVWEADTGKPVGPPLQHGNTARVWECGISPISFRLHSITKATLRRNRNWEYDYPEC